MNLRISALAAVSGVALLGSCATAPDQITHSPKAQKELAEALAGYRPGPPVNCVPPYGKNNMQIIDDYTLLFRDGRTIYVQNPRGGCPALGLGGYTLVTRPFGVNQMCSGDINRVVDLRSGTAVGSCVFSPFVPYTKSAS
jgi:hypothetical protein